MKNRERIRADIEQFGWHVTGVFDPDHRAPPFAYTIGLRLLKHPEIIIFGLNNDLTFMHRVLNRLGARVRAGERFEHGATNVPDVLPGYACAFARLPLAAMADHLGQAMAYFESAQLPVVQCIWPDPAGRMPWAFDAPPPLVARQPVFLRPDAGPREPSWPFTQPHSEFVHVSEAFVEGRSPLRSAEHTPQGWRFRSAGTQRLIRATLGFVVDREPTVAAVSALEPGHRATRQKTGAWVSAPIRRRRRPSRSTSRS